MNLDKPRNQPAPKRAKRPPKPQAKAASEPRPAKPLSGTLGPICALLDGGVHGKFAGLLRSME